QPCAKKREENLLRLVGLFCACEGITKHVLSSHPLVTFAAQ
ncbi:MAG: hypothetical protein ACI8VL_000517, partial [Bacteroidia bacterium]